MATVTDFEALIDIHAFSTKHPVSFTLYQHLGYTWLFTCLRTHTTWRAESSLLLSLRSLSTFSLAKTTGQETVRSALVKPPGSTHH